MGNPGRKYIFVHFRLEILLRRLHELQTSNNSVEVYTHIFKISIVSLVFTFTARLYSDTSSGSKVNSN